MRGDRPRPEQPPRIRSVRVAKSVSGVCADCNEPAALKKDGSLARLCVACLRKDRKRAEAERLACRAAPTPEYG